MSKILYFCLYSFLQKDLNYSKVEGLHVRVFWALKAAPILLPILGLFTLNIFFEVGYYTANTQVMSHISEPIFETFSIDFFWTTSQTFMVLDIFNFAELSQCFRAATKTVLEFSVQIFSEKDINF